MTTWLVGYDEFGNMLWNRKFTSRKEAQEEKEYIASNYVAGHHMVIELLDPNMRGIWGDE